MEQRRSIMMPAALTGSGRPPVPELSVLPLNSLPVISSLPPFTAHNGANVAAALSARSPTDCSSSISAPAARHTHIRRRKWALSSLFLSAGWYQPAAAAQLQCKCVRNLHLIRTRSPVSTYCAPTFQSISECGQNNVNMKMWTCQMEDGPAPINSTLSDLLALKVKVQNSVWTRAGLLPPRRVSLEPRGGRAAPRVRRRTNTKNSREI